MAILMTSPIFSPTTTKSAIYSLYSSSSSAIPLPKNHKFHSSTLVPQLGLGPFSSWNGLRHLGISVTLRSIKIGRKGRRRGNVVVASLFGVGAPEALVIGVVALLVFGPKGLAEVARNLGKTLREFQPTIRELQEVSKEFKNTLEKEIGLDEISSSIQDTYKPRPINPTASPPASNAGIEDSKNVVDPNGVSTPNNAYSSEEYLKITEEQLQTSSDLRQPQTPPPGESQSGQQLQASADLQQLQTPPPGESQSGQSEPQTEPLGTAQEGATATPPENRKNET